MLKGVQVSSGGVRGVWSRHGLLTRPERLLRLEKATAERNIELSDEQIRLLERFSPKFRERHIETRHTGDLVAVDTFFVGSLKGVGKVYLQTAIDCFSLYAWARLYTSKLPVTAVHLMNNDVLPTFEQHKARITTVLSDNGREFCAGKTAIPTSSSSSSRRSSIAPPGSSARSPTASSSACTEPCSMSISTSWVARSGTRPSKRCRPISTSILPTTIPNDRTRDAP